MMLTFQCAFIVVGLQQYVCVMYASLQQNDDLLFALRMLSLGLGAWQIIDSQVFTEPKLVILLVMRTLYSVARLAFVILLCYIKHYS